MHRLLADAGVVIVEPSCGRLRCALADRRSWIEAKERFVESSFTRAARMGEPRELLAAPAVRWRPSPEVARVALAADGALAEMAPSLSDPSGRSEALRL